MEMESWPTKNTDTKKWGHCYVYNWQCDFQKLLELVCGKSLEKQARGSLEYWKQRLMDDFSGDSEDQIVSNTE